MRLLTLCFCLLLPGCAETQLAPPGAPTMHWVVGDSPVVVSLRGLHVVDAQIAWASGAGGTYLRTLTGGQRWSAQVVPGAQELDFRDVFAVDGHRAWLLSAGPGAASRIYGTDDGGLHWRRLWTNPHPEGFLDGFAWWSVRRGIAYGDPVEGRMFVMTTDDAGRTWTRVPDSGLEKARPGEAGFAASGTGICTHGARTAWFATGGPQVARVFRSVDGGQSWTFAETPLADPSPTSGIFSMAFRGALRGVAVGGDYAHPERVGFNAAWTEDGGLTWHAPTGAPPRGYRSGVSWGDGVVVAVGPTGTDVSTDGGRSWSPGDSTSLHAVHLVPGGAHGSGAGGRLATLR